MLALFLPLLLGVTQAQQCPSGWSAHAGNCYRHFDTGTERMLAPAIRDRCAQNGAQLAHGVNAAERQFMEQLNRPSFNGKAAEYKNYQDALYVGLFRNELNLWVPMDHDTNISWPLPWCADVKNLHTEERCVIHLSSATEGFCYRSIHCYGAVVRGFHRFICKKIMKEETRPAVDPNQKCENGWSEHANSCYRHYRTTTLRLLPPAVRERCALVGATLAQGVDPAERQFLEQLARPSFNGLEDEYNNYGDQVLLGLLTNELNIWGPMDTDAKISLPLPWCNDKLNLQAQERCVVLRGFANSPFCYRSIHCYGAIVRGFRRYICKKPKAPSPIVCNNKDTILQGGKCVCKPGTIDIRDSDAVDRREYLEGEKCVPKEPCHSLQQPFSVIFIVDASNSIEQRNWPSLVNFLKSGARLLPNDVNVGFIKFSTEVTFAKWLPSKWTVSEFQQMVPVDFDAGYTNTPAAIQRAIEMFDRDSSRDKIAVLITDGLPVIDEVTDKQKGLADTQAAVKQLRQKGVKLVALGFGPDLPRYDGDLYIKQWLDDPEEDYFSFDRMAGDLRNIHMQILLQKVCRRYT